MDQASPRAPEHILDADEIAAELVPEAGHTRSTPMQQLTRASAPPPPKAAIARPLAGDPTELTGTGQRPPPMAAGLGARLQTAEAELTRLRRQMRARDAYLLELERALDASTRRLEASGLGSVEDAHRLLGRLRGQTFRIAELESELRQMELRLSRLTRLLPGGL